ncbi:DUF5133 domain-containing protein [Streptomyces sp. NPDC001941]|uniref:DUF5133 domain-containing protein n=1 Tax=Streptomyces sp. NPDC001941 TaxID=3154659 RepID=UPI00333432A0
MVVPAEGELRRVLARFDRARTAHEGCPSPASSRSLDDATYTLCVMTGTRTAEEAVAVADELLARRPSAAGGPVGQALAA